LAAAGDTGAAIAWFDRARRLQPSDRSAVLALATSCLGRDDARAATLFAGVLEETDLREAGFGLAAARLSLGQTEAAAVALHAALSRHAMLADGVALAGSIATAAAAPGWCGLSTDRRLLVGQTASRPGARPSLTVNGRVLAPAVPPHGIALPRDAVRSARLEVRIDGHEPIGSPIALAAFRRLEGVVACQDGGLEGWAWHPADPDRAPLIDLCAADGSRCRTVTARLTDSDAALLGAPPLARPYRFRFTPVDLAGSVGPFSVLGRDGGHLPGSPLDPRAERRRVTPRAASRPPATVPRRRPVSVVIPVFAGLDATLACLESVFAHSGRARRIVVIDDASPESALSAALDGLAARRRIVLIRHARNLGFPASANAGLRASAGRDVVLLNSDTLVPPGWLGRLRDAAYAAPETGSATPLSNDASIVSYPGPAGTNPVPDAARTARLDRLARRANGAGTVAIPVGIGFCLYLRHDCLHAATAPGGPLRQDVFAQGYGEEADFCLRAARLGWRHVAATGVFVGHVGGGSFGGASRMLLARNQAVLNRLHPGYDAAIGAWLAADPLATARRRIDEARWHDSATRPAGRAALFITHGAGGGVERQVAARCAAAALAGENPVVLRPAGAAAGAVALDPGGAGAYPNLIYALPAERRRLLARLRAARPARIELHHLLGHHPALLDLPERLGVPIAVHVHDYALFCPRITLLGVADRYCGEPDLAGCVACVADPAARPVALDVPVQALRDRSARLLAQASGIVVPSADTARRLRRHFPAVRPLVRPHEAAAVPRPDGETLPPRAGIRRRVVTAGALGAEKGFAVLLDCARDAAARDLPLEFVVVGHTIDDARLLGTGRVFVTGEFAADEAPALIRAQRGALGLLPSIWPETWCFALGELWRAGLRVAAFDIGAQAERVRAAGDRGLLLPLGLPIRAINNVLLAAARLSGHE
jgi:GT2 family glycosyltransferase/glycosyltransferase involved in cell wall biosynthesis